MIHNIVFDMGRVLTPFDPDDFIRIYVTDPNDIRLIRSELFESELWTELDRGTLTERELAAPFCARMPERLKAPAADLLLHWRDHMRQLDNILPLVRGLKERGYALYLLSNAGREMLRYTYKLSALRYFSGLLFSGEVLCLKPEPEIYRRFFERFSLKPQECFFIDDNEKNIEAGRRLGMQGFVYRGDLPPLYRALARAGVSLPENLRKAGESA